jgi:hypothetical protein
LLSVPVVELIVMRLALQVEPPHLEEARCKLLAGQAAIVLALLLVELEPPFQETLAAAMAATAVWVAVGLLGIPVMAVLVPHHNLLVMRVLAAAVAVVVALMLAAVVAVWVFTAKVLTVLAVAGLALLLLEVVEGPAVLRVRQYVVQVEL